RHTGQPRHCPSQAPLTSHQQCACCCRTAALSPHRQCGCSCPTATLSSHRKCAGCCPTVAVSPRRQCAGCHPPIPHLPAPTKRRSRGAQTTAAALSPELPGHQCTGVQRKMKVHSRQTPLKIIARRRRPPPSSSNAKTDERPLVFAETIMYVHARM
uniref:Uncharacterized protein n=1 Tax=Aegilops tauschii subsp. strangulata TaxID=200361 RepID=A0A452ZD53_AEGTS